NPDSFVLGHAADPRDVSAVISAPAFLSGMTDEKIGMVRQEILHKLHPAHHEEIKKLEWALGVCGKAVKVAQQRIAERAGMRRSREGNWLHNSETEPRAA